MTIPEQLANRDLSSASLEPLSEPPSRARIVVIGGGIVGSSIAYWLTKLGVTDVVVLERVRLTGGTTWHAAGLVAQVRGTHALTEISRINADLYESLPAETGIETGFRRVGALSVARTPERYQELLSSVSMARDFAVESVIVEPDRVHDLWPPAETGDVVGATFFPTDGTVNPGHAALALATGAKQRGATFVFGATATGFVSSVGRVTGVATDRGTVECEAAVIASGLWSSELARLAGAPVPLYPAEHVWVMTEEAPSADERLPVLRDLDGYLYIRHYRGRYLVGAFEPRGKPRGPRDIPTDGFVEFGEDWEHFEPVLAKARERLPELRTIGFSHYLRAPESFTPDANFHLGELPEAPGLWIAAGFNSQGIIYGPGAGRALAEWLVEGRPTMDLTEVDVARTGGWSNNRAWLHDKTYETLGRLYAMHWPGLQSEVGRDVRRVPLFERLNVAGAAFGEAAGWERAAWFEPGATESPVWGYDFDRPSWHDAAGEESRACREAVALFDLSTYAKFIVQGSEAVPGMRRLCTSDVDVEPGRVVYTLLCNPHGGIEMDPTVTRLGEDRFLVVAPTMYQRRVEWLLRRGLPEGATVTDVTSGYAVIHVAGPRSRELLSRVTDADLGNEAFGFLRAREIELGYAKAWALRVSYTGELGWELYTATEFANGVYDRLVSAGADLGLRHAGAFAFDALRLERGFRSWGHDVGAIDDPFSGGLGFAVHLDGGREFVGADALARLREASRERRLVSIRMEDPTAMLWHGESVVEGERRIGHVTSGGYGHTLGRPVGLAWVHGEVPERAEVEICARRVPATLSVAPFYDPKGERVRM